MHLKFLIYFNRKLVVSLLQIKEDLTTEILWRKKELQNIKKLYDKNIIQEEINIGSVSKIKITQTAESKYILRSAVPLIYAHWEGFFKKSIDIIHQELDTYSVDYNKLDHSILAALTLNKHTEEYKFKELKFNDIIVNMESNLKWKVLEKFTNRYNLNLKKYEKYKSVIQEILKVRNAISHGENAYHFEDITKINDYINNTIKLMLLTRNEVMTYLEYQNYYKIKN